jgi:FkbM family methyltransferase
VQSLRATVSELRVCIGLARQLAPLAPNRVGAVLNGVAILRVWIADRGWRELPRPILVRVVYLGQRFDFAAANQSEIRVLKEMFLEKQYSVHGLRPKIIVDLGSNVGASIAYFRATYPDAEIIGMEPDPGAFERLSAMLEPISGVRVFPWAIADRTGHLSFHRAEQSWESALVPQGTGTLEVETVTLPDLLARLQVDRVDLLKLDVEGAEWLMFEEPSVFNACQTIVGELHLDDPSQTIERAGNALDAFDMTVTVRMGTRANFVARRLLT